MKKENPYWPLIVFWGIAYISLFLLVLYFIFKG
jgi:hypothetical protein